MKVKALFISDVHLGSKGSKASALLEMLKRRFGSTQPLNINFSNGLTAQFNKNILSIKIK